MAVSKLERFFQPYQLTWSGIFPASYLTAFFNEGILPSIHHTQRGGWLGISHQRPTTVAFSMLPETKYSKGFSLYERGADIALSSRKWQKLWWDYESESDPNTAYYDLFTGEKIDKKPDPYVYLAAVVDPKKLVAQYPNRVKAIGEAFTDKEWGGSYPNLTQYSISIDDGRSIPSPSDSSPFPHEVVVDYTGVPKSEIVGVPVSTWAGLITYDFFLELVVESLAAADQSNLPEKLQLIVIKKDSISMSKPYKKRSSNNETSQS